jgi:hypothetical protein
LKETETDSKDQEQYASAKTKQEKNDINESESCFMDNILVIVKSTNGEINSQVDEIKKLQCQMFSIDESRSNELMKKVVEKYGNIEKVSNLAKIMFDTGGMNQQKREQLLKSANILGLSESDVDDILDNIVTKTPKNVLKFN